MGTMAVNTNVLAINAHNILMNVDKKSAKASQKLASGLRINVAGDDAAGLSISEKMRAQIRGLNQAERNVQDGVSLFQIAEGALQVLSDLTIRIRELSVQAMNDTNTGEDRSKLNDEVKQILTEIDALSERTEFNTIKILKADKVTIQNAYRSTYTMDSANVRSALMSIDFAFDRGNDYMQLFMYNGNTNTSNADAIFKLSEYLYKVDNDFENFIKTQLYNNNGTISDGNADYFANTLIAAINLGLKENSRSPIPAEIVGGYNPADGYLYLGFKDGSLFSAYTCATTSGSSITTQMGTASIGHAFLHTMFNTSSGRTDFNIFDDKRLYIQMGANAEQGRMFKWHSVSVSQMGLEFADISDREKAGLTLKMSDRALNYITEIRSTVGVYINMLEHTMNSLRVTSDETSAAESRIRDADMAKEMMEYTKANIMSSSAMSVLAQANQTPQMLIMLLRT